MGETAVVQCSRCLATVTAERRSCPLCGAIVNSEGVDPPVQDAARSTTTIANLRTDNANLRVAIETAADDRLRSEQESAMLREALAELASEHRETMEELLALKAMMQSVDERCRDLRSRLEGLGISTYRPLEANQAPLFAVQEQASKRSGRKETSS